MSFTYKLPVGAKILREVQDLPNNNGAVILCKWDTGASSHVTWKVDMNGYPYQGHYFRDEALAIADFADRVREIWPEL